MKSIVNILLLCLLFSGLYSADGQAVAKRNLFQPYSESFIKESLPAPGSWHPFPSTANEWRKLLPDSVVNQYIANGEKALKENITVLMATDFLDFTRTSNRSRFEAIYMARRSQLFSLVMAETMEGKGGFSDKIANLVWAICEESFWGLPAHIKGMPDAGDPYVDLFAAETASLLAWTSYFVGAQLDQVSPRLNQRIKIETERRIMIPMRTASWFWVGTGDPKEKLNNWSPWIMSNYITVAILLENDENLRAAAIKKGLNTIGQYLDGLPDDGAINEGPIYWFPSIGCVFDALAVLDNASNGRINLYQQPLLRKAAAFIYQLHIDSLNFVNMGDAAVSMHPDGISVFRIGKAIGDTTLAAFGSYAAKNLSLPASKPIDRMFSRRFFNLVAMDSCYRYEGRYVPSQDAWIDGIQMMCSRSKNGFFVATHGGHNGESHNQNDVGDFIVYLDGFPVLMDVGRGTYTGRTFSSERYSLWFNTSAYHNLPEVNGMQQKDGEQFAARDVHYTTNNQKSEVEIDIAAAYPAGAGILNWNRKTTLFKKGEVRVSDRYVLKTPSDVVQHFMTACPADINQPGQIIFTLPNGRKAILNYPAKHWVASKEMVPLVNEEDEDIRNSWKGQTIVRISLERKKKSSAGDCTIFIKRKD
jgi:hypothetical protein